MAVRQSDSEQEFCSVTWTQASSSKINDEDEDNEEDIKITKKRIKCFH